jgi:hypothetical protein
MSRDGLGRFLLRLGLFLAGFFVVLDPVLCRYFDRVALRDSLLRRADRQFAAVDSLEVLVLGDSHPQKAVDPRHLEGAFNFATSGESYLQTYWKASELLRGNPLGVEVVLLPVDMHSFSSFRTERIVAPLYWRRYIGPGELFGRLGPKAALLRTVDCWIAPYKGRLDLSELSLDMLLGRRGERPLVRGYRPAPADSMPDTERGVRRMARERCRLHFGGDNPLDRRLLKAFRDVVRLCREEGVEVVLVSYPVSREYLEVAQRSVSRGELAGAVDSVLAGCGPVRWLDYTGLFRGRREYFSDTDHLSVSGAEALTGRLGADLEGVPGGPE